MFNSTLSRISSLIPARRARRALFVVRASVTFSSWRVGEPGLGRTIVADVEGAHKIELLVRGCVVGFIMSLRGSVTARAKHDSTASMPKRRAKETSRTKENPRTKESKTEAIRRCPSPHSSSRDYSRTSCIWYFANCINGTPTSSMHLLLAVLVTAPTMWIVY